MKLEKTRHNARWDKAFLPSFYLIIPYSLFENNNELGTRPILVLHPPPTRVLCTQNESLVMELSLNSNNTISRRS
jgi:hypothetical protein